VPEHRRPTIADVAAAAGVSRTTVSHALSGAGKVNADTRALVQRVAIEVGYRPSPRARALRGGRSNVLGVVSSMSRSVAGGPARLGFYMEVAAAAAERALAHGYALVLVPPTGDGPTAALDSVALDGVIVVEPAEGDPLVGQVRRNGIPFVSLGQVGADGAVSQVDLHPVAVADLLVGHLADQGVRQPALMVGDRPRPSYQAVVHRFRTEARDRGWTPTVLTLPEGDGAAGARAATRELLRSAPSTDGIIAFVDAFAAGVMAGLAELERRVPDDVLVLTRYDGVLARTSSPAITAVDLHLGAAAARAVDLLVEELGGPVEAQPPALPAAPPAAGPTLVVRASSQRGGQQQHPGRDREAEHAHP
jgi:DNA-binding LacI/PurR family transcriptional regulator